MLKTVQLLSFVLALAARVAAQPITVHPVNPHYFLFNGQPTVLITSAEHYGAVINLDFNYVGYLDALKAQRAELHARVAGRGARDGGRILPG